MILRHTGAAHAFPQDAGGFKVGTTGVPIDDDAILDLRCTSRHIAMPNVIRDRGGVTIKW